VRLVSSDALLIPIWIDCAFAVVYQSETSEISLKVASKMYHRTEGSRNFAG
jgi:hypothetical protein